MPFPDGLVWVGTGRHKGVGRHLVRRKRSRAGFGMGDREGRGMGDREGRGMGDREGRGRGDREGRGMGDREGRGMGDREGRGMGDREGRGMGDREGRGMGDREGRPYAGLVAEPCSGVGATLVVAHAIAPAGRAVAPCRFPDGLVGSVRDATRVWDATSYEGNEAVLDSGWATARVAGWATARVAPTRASSPSCSGRRGDACRRPRLSSPMPFPDGLVWVGTGRHEGVGRYSRARRASRRSEAKPRWNP